MPKVKDVAGQLLLPGIYIERRCQFCNRKVANARWIARRLVCRQRKCERQALQAAKVPF